MAFSTLAQQYWVNLFLYPVRVAVSLTAFWNLSEDYSHPSLVRLEFSYQNPQLWVFNYFLLCHHLKSSNYSSLWEKKQIPVSLGPQVNFRFDALEFVVRRIEMQHFLYNCYAHFLRCISFVYLGVRLLELKHVFYFLVSSLVVNHLRQLRYFLMALFMADFSAQGFKA